MNFSKEQLEVIQAPITEKTIVMAAAASGKTATLTERVRFLLRNGVNPKGIVAITFTNNAAVEMRERLGEDFKEGMFMGTMHSYANMLLTANGHDTTMIRVDQEFDRLFDMLQTYPECLREIDYLLCDESQDLNPYEFEFITEMLEPKACLIVGDVRQCIYQFKDADPEMLMRLMTNENFVIRSLNENYRNGTSILELSNTLLDKMTDIPSGYSIPMKKNSGTVRFISSYHIVNCLKKDPVWGKWAILCRANKTVEAIMAMLTKAGIPSITFRQAQGTLADLRDKMNQNAVKVLTIHSSKGLEFDNVIIRDYWTKNQEAIHLSYVAVTRARNNLFICKEGR